MNFPMGSLVLLLVFIVISSGLVAMPKFWFSFIVLSLAGILLGSFLSIPLPSPQGLNFTLNIGHGLIPLVVAGFLWVGAKVEDKYRASLGTLAVGLTLYGVAALLELEPGLIKYPLVVCVPFVVLIAMLTGKSKLGSSLALINGCTLASILRVLEVLLAPESASSLDLPDSLVWNTMSIGVVADLGIMGLVDLATQRYELFRSLAEDEAQEDHSELELADEASPVSNQLTYPEQ